jgi:hypothetical protein
MVSNSNVKNGAFGLAILIIVTLIVIILIVWAVLKHKREKENNEVVIWPPNDYMLTVGSKCPDYWVDVGTDGTKTICQNKFNIPVAKDSVGTEGCYDNVTDFTNVKTFQKLTKWPATTSDLASRKKWIEQCGIKTKTSASWIGIPLF